MAIGEGRAIPPPKPLPSPRKSKTPVRETRDPPKERIRPLRTEGLEEILPDTNKKVAGPKGQEKPKGPDAGRRPRRQPQPAPRKRDPSAHKKRTRDRGPSAHNKRQRPPSPPRERERKRDPSARKDHKRRRTDRSAPLPRPHRTGRSRAKENDLQPRRSLTHTKQTRFLRHSSRDMPRQCKIEKLSRAMRNGSTGKERFPDYQRPAFDMAAEIFVAVGYTSWGKVKTIQQTARGFMLADLRRTENRRPLEDLTLLLDIFDVYERQRKTRIRNTPSTKRPLSTMP